MNNVIEMKNKKVTKKAIFVLMFALTIALAGCGKKDKEDADTEGQVAEVAGTSAIDNIALTPTTDTAIITLINTYYTASQNGDIATIETLIPGISEEEKIRIQKKSEYIESVDNIKVYTQPGQNAGTYIAFIYTEMKFYGIDTKAPGLKTNIICTNDDGSLYILNRVDDSMMEYIKQVASNSDVADFFNQVTVAYSEALAADANLAQFMNTLSTTLDDAVAQAQQNADAEVVTTEQPTVTPTEETVKAKETVNLRASDSEQADILGKVTGGDSLTRLEARDNGWSRVNYNGTEGFVKSEYLDAPQAATEQPTVVDNAAATEQPAESTTTPAAGGSMTAKEEVRVRNTPSTASDDSVIGKLSAGQSVEIVEHGSDGWSKIKYNGQDGYVKTEFLQ